MPELPEVETIKNDLKKKILARKITDVIINKNKIIRNQSDDFIKVVKGDLFESIDRVGKLLIFKLAKADKFMLVHLKMTGQLIYRDKHKLIAGGHSLTGNNKIPGIGDRLPNKYTHVIFKLSGNGQLFFNDLRQFGYLQIVDENELKKIKENYGIEPLTARFNLKNFQEVLKNRKVNIKAILLNQKLIAGIGNIYADESLFRAGIRPSRQAKTLTRAEIRKLWQSISYIIGQAIKYRGTTFSNYVDSRGQAGNFAKLLKVYGRKGQKCYKCSGIVKKIKIAARGTHYCPRCQK